MRQQKFFYLWYFLLFVDELFCSCPSEQLNEATWEILSRVSDCFVFSFSAWATLVCIYWKYLHESSDDITHVSCKYVLILNVSNFQPMHSLQHCIQATFSLFVCSHEIFDWSFSNASSSTATSDEVKFERSSQASIRHFTILKNFSFLCLRQLSARLSIDLIYVSQSENVFWLKFPIFFPVFLGSLDCRFGSKRSVLLVSQRGRNAFDWLIELSFFNGPFTSSFSYNVKSDRYQWIYKIEKKTREKIVQAINENFESNFFSQVKEERIREQKTRKRKNLK